MLPEGLSEEDMINFKTLAKFAFNSYHKGMSKNVTFFQEDIPEGLFHFGFMNESTEMYAGKGVEKTFSFLHLSLQEYLAAWHLADSYSIAFQVAYHRLAVDPYEIYSSVVYKGEDKEEKALLTSLKQQSESLVEPAIFLAGITGWRCQSEDDMNHWEMYLSHDTAEVYDYRMVLLHSLYEAQNPNILSKYFSAEGSQITRKMFPVRSSGAFRKTPYACQQARTQGGFEGVRTNPLFAGYTYSLCDRLTLDGGLVRSTMARDPRLLAYFTHIARRRVWPGFGGLTLYVKEGESGPGDGGIH